MRILHTADWHLGQHFLGKNRGQEHRLFLDWLLQTIQKQKIDVLIVAGDIFDVANPPNNALQQYYNFLLNVRDTSCKDVVIIGGNHDGVSTLNAPKELLATMNIHVVGGVTGDIDDEVKIIRRKERVAAVIAAVPFLRDRDVRISVAGESYEDRISNLRRGIIGHYRDVWSRVEKYKGVPRIAMGHLYAVGGEFSDSERDIHLGNLASIDIEGFEGFDYVALGHLHSCQRVGERGYYSGSPIPLSFSEREDNKHIIIFDDDVKILPIPIFRRLLRFVGTFDDVVSKIENHISGDMKDWAEVVFEEESYEERFRDFLSQIDNVEVLKYSVQKQRKTIFQSRVSLKELREQEVFEKMIPSHYDESQCQELKNCFTELLNENIESTI